MSVKILTAITYPPLSMKLRPANTHGRYIAYKKEIKKTLSAYDKNKLNDFPNDNVQQV